MNDLDLYERLSDPIAGGEEMLETLKTAGLKDDAKLVLESLYNKHVAPKKPELLGGAVAAGLGGLTGYAVSKRWKKGHPSLEEKSIGRLADEVEPRTKDSKSYPGKALNVTVRYAREMSKVLSDHPIAGGALAAAALAKPLGSSFGRKVADEIEKSKVSGAGMATGLRPIPKPGAALQNVMKPPAPPLPRVKVAVSMNQVDQARRAINNGVGYYDRLKGPVSDWIRKSGPVDRAVAGGVAGAALGGASGGGYEYDRNGRLKKKSRIGRALLGGAAGAAAGALSHPEGRQWAHGKLTGVDKILKKQAELEKDALLGQAQALLGRAGKAMSGLYAQGAQQAKAVGLQAAQRVTPHLNKVGPAVGAFAKKVTGVPGAAGAPGVPGYSLKQRVGVPALAGAAIGGVRHMMKPKNPNTGQRDGSLVGSMAGGAALGAGAGLASKGFIEEARRNRHVADFLQGRLGTRPAGPVVQQASMVLPKAS